MFWERSDIFFTLRLSASKLASSYSLDRVVFQFTVETGERWKLLPAHLDMEKDATIEGREHS